MEKRTLVLKRDEEGVSPVIATILMVAITVVLAAVLYVMVSGLINPGGSSSQAMGVNVRPSTDGSNWTVTISNTPTGKALSTTNLVIKNVGGGIALQSAPLSTYVSAEVNGVRYIQSGSGSAVAVGDSILIDAVVYPTGFRFEIVGGGSILASGVLQG